MTDHSLRVLHPGAPGSDSRAPGRRSFLAAALAVGSTSLLTACGGNAVGSPTHSGLEDSLNIYTWGEYDAPSTAKDFSKDTGVRVTMDTYASNEEMIAKLGATKGTSGYDIVVPSSYYIPEMVENDLLMKLDEALLPNLSNVADAFRGKGVRRTHAICKNWGTTGYLYDTTVIKRELSTWGDFFDAATKEATGSTSMVEDPGEIVAAYFNANGIDENTTSAKHYGAAKAYLVDKIAPHIQAFDSYPSTGAVQQNTRALAQAWNGDARTGLLGAKDTSRWKWVLPSPTNRWQDNWAVVKGAPHPRAAHAFINTVLSAAVSYRELEYIGYDTGITKVANRARQAKLPFADLVFFPDDKVSTMTEGEITSATPRQSQILDAMRARAAK